ncbi:hypothetical protein M8494_12015 [Serratia ureilytica]
MSKLPCWPKSGDAGTELYAHYHSRQPLSEAMRRTLYGELPNAHIPQRSCITRAAGQTNGKIDYRTWKDNPGCLNPHGNCVRRHSTPW